jgi:hypothetical protein
MPDNTASREPCPKDPHQTTANFSEKGNFDQSGKSGKMKIWCQSPFSALPFKKVKRPPILRENYVTVYVTLFGAGITDKKAAMTDSALNASNAARFDRPGVPHSSHFQFSTIQ